MATRNGVSIDVDVWEAFLLAIEALNKNIGASEDEWGPWFDFFAHGWDACAEWQADQYDRAGSKDY